MGSCCSTEKPIQPNKTQDSEKLQIIKPHPCEMPLQITPSENIPEKAQPVVIQETQKVNTGTPKPTPKLQIPSDTVHADKSFKVSKIEPKTVKATKKSCLEEEKLNRTVEAAFKLASQSNLGKSSVQNKSSLKFMQEAQPTGPVPSPIEDKDKNFDDRLYTKESCPRQSLYMIDNNNNSVKAQQIATLHEESKRSPILALGSFDSMDRKIPAYVSMCTKREIKLSSICKRTNIEESKHVKNISTTDTNFNKMLYCAKQHENPESKNRESESMLDRKEIVSILSSGSCLKSYVRNAIAKNNKKSVPKTSEHKATSEINDEKNSEIKEKPEPILGGFYNVTTYEAQNLISPDKVFLIEVNFKFRRIVKEF